MLQIYQLLERALQEYGDDLDSAIKSLTELRIGSVEINSVSAAERTDLPPQGMTHNGLCYIGLVLQIFSLRIFQLNSGMLC